MKKLILLFAIAPLLINGCKDTSVEERSTALQYFTPYANYPEFLNGQIKTVEEKNYFAVVEDGQVIKGPELQRSDRDSLKWSNDFKAYFSGTGDVIKVDVYYDKDDTRLWMIDYEGNLMKRASFIMDDTARIYYDYVFDENGHFKSARRMRAGVDTLLNLYAFESNQEGFITSGESYTAKNELLQRWLYELNEENLTTRLKTYNMSDSLLNDTKVEYNDAGFYTRAEYLTGTGEVRRINTLEYLEYDSKGNWLQSVVTDNDTLRFFTVRTYEYYPDNE